MRRFFCIFLLMLLPLHSFAMQGTWLSATSAYDLTHELEHLEGTSHHHDDNGSIHYDDSTESTQHFLDHAASAQTATLPSSSALLSPTFTFFIATSEHSDYIPDPVPERPQRPPSSLG